MQLHEIVRSIVLKKVYGDTGIEVTGVSSDSRQVQAGDLFVAFRGDHVDGHDYIEQAIARGAVAVLVEKKQEWDIPQVVVPSTRRIAPYVAHSILGFPASSLSMVGVTGTNGKTTTTMLIEHILQKAGKETGLIGTIAQRTSKGELRSSVMTTPESVELVKVIREMNDLGAKYVVMEVSSHALELHRVAGIPFRVAVFTNLTQDHLDFHPTMEAYGNAKGKLFSRLGNAFMPQADGGLQVAVVNADDEWSHRYASDTVQQVITYGIQKPADVQATEVQVKAEGVAFHLVSFAGVADIQLQMTGRFSVYNALAAIAASLALGIGLEETVAALEEVQGVPGRFERVNAGQDFSVIVDYSHTPDSLENALATIHEFCEGKIITVVGCGGDRDRKKRPLMAQIAASYSDFTVLTSDNPRTEDPEAIIDDMEAGLDESLRNKYTRLVRREEGIRYAIHQAKPGDVILIAGKGHETYQIIGTTKYDFDDRMVAARIIQENNG